MPGFIRKTTWFWNTLFFHWYQQVILAYICLHFTFSKKSAISSKFWTLVTKSCAGQSCGFTSCRLHKAEPLVSDTDKLRHLSLLVQLVSHLLIFFPSLKNQREFHYFSCLYFPTFLLKSLFPRVYLFWFTQRFYGSQCEAFSEVLAWFCLVLPRTALAVPLNCAFCVFTFS